MNLAPPHLGPEKGHAEAAPALGSVLVSLAELLERADGPESFFQPYLSTVAGLVHGKAAAIWLRDPRGNLAQRFAYRWETLQCLQEDKVRASHRLLVEEAAAQARSVWLSLPADAAAAAAVDASAFLFAPILIDKTAVGLLEIALTPPADRAIKRSVTRMVTDLAGVAAAFLHKKEWQHLQEHQAFWNQLDAFADQVHQTLNSTEVSCLVANEGKRLLGCCDQLAVGVRQGERCRITSVSGAAHIEQRSPLIRSMANLLQHACAWGEEFSYSGERDESLPPQVFQALDEYLALCKPAFVFVKPLIASAPGAKVVGAMVIESYDQVPATDTIRPRIAALARHSASALTNALRHERLPLRWLTGPLAALNGGGSTGWPIATGVLVLVAILLAFVQIPHRVEATGQLVPTERRMLFATRNGKVVHVAARQGDYVSKGQEVLFIEDLDTQAKADQLLVRMSSLDQKLAFLDEQLTGNMTSKERADFLTERIKANYELQKAKVERDLLLAEARNPRKAPVASPLSGQVITFDAREKLAGKSVKIGDPLLRVAEVDGAWEVELFLPEEHVGRVRGALERSATGELAVQLLLASDPQRTYLGTLPGNGLGGETIVQKDKVVLPARVVIADRALLSQLARMPVGVEVQARIESGHGPVGQVWFGEVWDFLYRRFIF